VVFLLSGFVRGGAVFGTVGTLIASSYLINFLSPILTLPRWMLDLSVFYQYGAPILRGIAWTSILGMFAMVFVLLVGATTFWLHADLKGGS
jgi:ABC-2 type transport system permease protein